MRTQTPALLFLAAVGLFIGRDLLFPVLHFGHSAHIDLIRQIEVNQAYGEGYVYPRWIADFYFGRGSPIFNFYAPMNYLIGQWFVLLGVPPLWAVKLVYVLCIVAAGIAMYLLVRETWGAAAGTAAGVIYMFTPYLLADVFVRSALGELSAFVWLPMAMFFLVRTSHNNRTNSASRAACAIALLCLSHNVGAMIGMPVLLLWTLFTAQRATWRKMALALAGGLALSAFFWFPALAEKAYLNAEANLTQGHFHFSRHFIPLAKLWDTAWEYGTPGARRGPSMSVQAGRLHLLLLLPAVAYTVAAYRKWIGPRRAAAALVITAAGALFMTSSASEVLWASLPLLPFVQFPFRFLMPLATATSAMAGPAVWWVDRRYGRRGRWAAAVVLIVAAFAAYAPYARARYLFHDAADLNRTINVDKETARQMRGSDGVAEAQEFLTPEVLREARESKTTALDDYLPIWVREKPKAYFENRFETLADDAHLTVLEERGARYRFRVESKSESRVLAHTFYFPGWTARVDGRRLPLEPDPTTGEIVVSVPAGRNTVTLAYEDTPARMWSKLVSASAAALMILLIGVEQYRHIRPMWKRYDGVERRRAPRFGRG